MKDDFPKSFCLTVALILALLVLDRLPAFMGQSRNRHLLERVLQQMHNADLNREDFDALAAGYYEGLRKDAGPIGMPAERDDVRFRDDFLRYELRPSVKRSYPAGMRITNSLGMANPEYAYEKPPLTRRIALLGDSVSLGPYGHDYAALLEGRLNRDCLTPEIRRFEILNFAVYGYSVVQMMDVALEKAPKFHPDVYVLAMANLEVLRKAGWRTHLGRLVVSGGDLKYDYLRRVVVQAGVQPTDHLAVIEKKLAPFSLPVIRWALEQVRDHAASQGAQMIIVLVPTPIDPKFVAADFDRLHLAIDGVGVPVIDLRDTFRSANPDDVQVVPQKDIHPNARGHEMLFENLYAKLRAQPEAWAALVGNATASPDQAKASSTGKSF
jgi:hypothetical protein